MNSTNNQLLVLGLGISGYAAAELALVNGYNITVLDENDSPELRERAATLKERGASAVLDYSDSQSFKVNPDFVVISPGIGPGSSLWHVAENCDCPVISEIEFAFRYVNCPIIAVTGTNGKSTTVELINYCLQHSGYRSQATGNVGFPLSEAVRKYRSLDYLVVEVSSFQLERIQQFKPDVAVFLNLSPDHLDRHKSVEEYYETKTSLFSNMTDARNTVVRKDLLTNAAVKRKLPAESNPVTFSADEDEDNEFFLKDNQTLCQKTSDGSVQVLCDRKDLRLRGRHNIENVLAAFAVGYCLDIQPETLRDAATHFPPHPHRLELINVREGIQYFNDSKATNPDSMARAIGAVADETKGSIVLIAGGLDKGLDFSEIKPLLAEHVKEVELIGKCRQRLAEEWRDTVTCRTFVSLESAVENALETAVYGDTVLLAPGCASQDMFKDYAERGETFNEIVKRRIGE